MSDLIPALQAALRDAIRPLFEDPAAADALDIPVAAVPDDKPGDYGSPVAFALAKALRSAPPAIAAQIAERAKCPRGVARIEAVGPYLNAYVDPGDFVAAVIEAPLALPATGRKVLVEHTSVNPNKEAHVGHLRNIVLGDALGRIERAAGNHVEVQNYIDDTGRQAAESIFAVRYFAAVYDGVEKYDHWLGRLYVQLSEAKERDPEVIETGVREVMHQLERGELRAEVERIVRAQLSTYHALGAEYDLLVWESDVVAAGLLERGLNVLRPLPNVTEPSEGKFAGALVMDVSEFLPGLEEPQVVLVRSDGNAMYVAKDIGYHLWKVGLLGGMRFAPFAEQPSSGELYTTHPAGELEVAGRSFGGADQAVNVIDVRQAHPQAIVRAALEVAKGHAADGASGGAMLHHLAYEVVTLEGEAMSGRKGITLAIDTVIDEATRRARSVIEEKSPGLEGAAEIARAVGIGALRFAMLKSEAKRIIDFRWEQALNLAGDSAPYVQYAHARADAILRAGAEAGVTPSLEQAATFSELEVKLAQQIARYPTVVRQAAREDAPHQVAQYALDLATAWNGYYNHRDANGKPDTAVLRSEPGLREARLALVAKVRDTLAATLALMGIEAPRRM